MIISHKLQIIFIHIPKNAGTFFTEIIKNLDNNYIEIFNEFDGHQMAKDCMYIFEKYPDYTRVAITRNIFSRMVSIYFYTIQTKQCYLYNKVKKYTFTEFVNYVMDNYGCVNNQIDYILSNDGRVIINEILRFEHLEEDIRRLFIKLGLDKYLPKINFARKNKSVHDDYKTYYNDELYDTVSKIFIKDLAYITLD